jgi:hypothetical protein
VVPTKTVILGPRTKAHDARLYLLRHENLLSLVVLFREDVRAT